MSYIKNFAPDAQYSTTERCDINELLNQSSDSHCSIAQAKVAPGVTTQLHAVLDTIERYIILEGEGLVFINNQDPEKVSYLDVVTIAEGIPQKIQNTGDTELVFLCICTPRFEQKNYRDLENPNLETLNLEEKGEYQPVSCDMHSQLELSIMHGKHLQIQFNQNNEIVTLSVKPTDIVTRKGEGEFLLASDQSGSILEIRLDDIKTFS